MDGKSLDITEENLKQLQAIFPQVFTEGKIDFKRLQDLLGGDSVTAQEFYALNWAGKSESRKEIQKQTTATLIPEPERSINFDTTQNIFIEGENLEVLRTLQKSYFGKIKMIYIDPPYNTGEDSFVYPDDYSERVDEFNKRTGTTDEDGFLNKQDLWKKNTKESGQYHSAWLSMMYPRLYLARNLMREDGVIFISIDDNEQANLKLLCDEVFGTENFRNSFVVRRYDKNLNRQFIEQGLKTFNVGFEYILCYSKSDKFFFNPIFKDSSEERQTTGYWKGFWNDADRPTMRYDILGYTPADGQWKWGKEKAEEAIENYKKYTDEFSSKMTIEEYWESTGKKLSFIRRNATGNGKNKGVENWIAPSDGTLRNTNWTDLFASKVDKAAEGFFDYPKNVEVIKNLIVGSCEEDSIILDFFAGSGTTAHAVLELNKEDDGNRKFIVVQMPEILEEGTEAYNAGHRTIADITRLRISNVIAEYVSKANGKLALQENVSDWGFQSYRISKSNFKKWDGNISGDQIIEQLKLHIDSVNPQAEKEAMLKELLLKGGKPITAKAELITTVEGDFYHLPEFNIVVCLNGYGKDTEEKIIALAPAQIIVLDKYFERDDALSNARNTMREAGIDKFTVI